MGGFEAGILVPVEPPLKYHPVLFGFLTGIRYPDAGQCLVGSLTGAVASQKVTEAREGSPQADWKPAGECNGTRELNCETDKSSRCESRS